MKPPRQARSTTRKWAGLTILVLVALIVFALQYFPPDPVDPGPKPPKPPESITVNGFYGGKEAFWADPEVIQILNDKFGLTVTGKRLPSIEMEKQCTANAGLDFCWPSNQNSANVIEANLPTGSYTDKVIFHTPVVFYSWGGIVDALIGQGIVEKRGDIYYVVDFPKLIESMLSGKTWPDIGVTQKVTGVVYVKTSDPEKSTTGNTFVGMVANTLNGEVAVDPGTLPGILPQLQTLFGGVLLPENNTKLWEDYLTKGIGDSPIIAGIESTLIEDCLEKPDAGFQDQLHNDVILLYPEPTVLTSHPLIALTDGGKRLMEALRDPEIQRLGWERHGFRSGVPGIPNNPICNLPGLRTENVVSIIPMPLPAVMKEIIVAIEAPPTAAPTADSAKTPKANSPSPTPSPTSSP